MPRPPDNYTHAQFGPVESEHQGETVQCIHCKNWTGSIKTLNRKKAHLLNCPQYATWRAQGNGQDLAPPNKYSKRDSSTMNGWDEMDPANPYYDEPPYGGPPPPQQAYTPTMVRGKNLDLSKYYDETWDESGPQKCMRTRCLHCGYTRAKNTTRQVEHLMTCQDFLASAEGQAAIANHEIELTQPAPSTYSNSALGPDIWRGGRPNPNLHVSQSGTRPSVGGSHSMRPPQRPAPSLVNHLLNKWPDKFHKSTQLAFLSHAGCGTLSSQALAHWLGQNGHVSRAMISFIGSLINKVRLPDASNSKQNTQYRALDLLISTVSNLRKEIDFIENTKRKYGVQADTEPPSPMTKAYVDLLSSSSESRSTLLEGMVALWATEHCYCASWQYASTFASNVPSSNYSVPSYLTGNNHRYSTGHTPFRSRNASDQHISAIQEALIPNWTSREFSKFVEACRAIVDELANAETTGSGRDQLVRCEAVYQQVVFLWERIWPEINGMGEEHGESGIQGDDSPSPSDDGSAGPSGANGTHGNKDGPIESHDDDDSGDADASGHQVDSPYGGTGLAAIAAANQAS